MINYTTEYLILNENNLDWDQLSSDSDDSFSLIEIRLFRKRINWKLYFRTHITTCPFDMQMLEMGSKYFDKETYSMLAVFNMIDQDFIEDHIEEFDFRDIIKHCRVDQDFLKDNIEKWSNYENLPELFKKSEFIDINSPDFSEIKLLIEMNS